MTGEITLGGPGAADRRPQGELLAALRGGDEDGC